MKTLRMKRTGHEDLIFDGELIAEGASCTDQSPRWHQIRVFSASEKFVLTINYHGAANETHIDYAEVLDGLFAVDATLKHNFDPCSQLVASNSEDLRAVANDLRGRFDAASQMILKTLKPEINSEIQAALVSCIKVR